MAKTNINIGGEVREVNGLQLPATGREYRDAWVFNGDMVEIDMNKAREIKIAKIIQAASARVAKAEQKALEKALKGQNTATEDAEVAKFKSKPKSAGIALVTNAATPEELDAITADQIWQ